MKGFRGHALIVAGSKKVDFRVGSDDPEPVILALEGVHGSPLVQVPNPDGLVLTRREDEVLVWVEQTAIGVLEVTSAGVDLELELVSTWGLLKSMAVPRREAMARKHTALVSLMRHSLISRSSPAETMRGMVGWKATQLTPLS
jgi:hypothetical protein